MPGSYTNKNSRCSVLECNGEDVSLQDASFIERLVRARKV